MEENTKPKTTDKLKDKRVISIIVGVILALLILGGIFFIFRGGEEDESSKNPIIGGSLDLPSLEPEDIGMVVVVREDGKALKFKLTNADDVELVEYTIEYEKEIDGELVPEGIFGIMEIGADGITETDFRPFGTCSSGRCRYDDVVSDVTIILKVTKTNGEEFQVKKIVKLEV